MSIYKSYTPEQIRDIQSRFLINSWSYSKVTQFARNEKAFEMIHVYGHRAKQAASSVAGNAYHVALQLYFESKQKGLTLQLSELESSAFEYIDSIGPNQWKLQKTAPTVEECVTKCTQLTVALLNNFYSERSVYEDDIDSVIAVEQYFNEYLTINGVDIPIPCHAIIDLRVKTKRGTIAVVDHKSKAAYTGDDEIKLSIGIQAVTYCKAVESACGVMADEVWFVENKYSQNKDKSPQLRKFVVAIDEDTLKLYESILYEPLRRVIQAASDPDYVYLINDSDSFIDRAEVYDFWAKTMIAEVEDFNVDPSKKQLVDARLKKIRNANSKMITPSVIKHFRQNAAEFIQYDLSNSSMTNSEKIEHVLRTFGVISKVAKTFDGYSSNTYLLEVSAGVKVASIHSHRLDIANALDVSNVRISKDLVVNHGKSYLSIESSKVRDRDLLFDLSEMKDRKIPLGKDNYGNTIIWDLDNHSTPHVLVCGATGSGKSVLLKTMYHYFNSTKFDEIVFFDPKFEFTNYGSISDIEEIEIKMQSLVEEMNVYAKAGTKTNTLIIFDEFADALAQAKSGVELNVYENIVVGISSKGVPKTKRECVDKLNSLEENLRILLQKGRSIGYRIVAATQRASVKVITGDAKVNFPVQICFRVPKETDSRVVLDEPGAESLAGMGDGLIRSPQYNDIVRFQAFYKQ